MVNFTKDEFIRVEFYWNLSRIQLPETVLLILTFILMSYIGYILKNGYTQISNLPAKLAVFLAITVLSSMVYSLIVWL